MTEPRKEETESRPEQEGRAPEEVGAEETAAEAAETEAEAAAGDVAEADGPGPESAPESAPDPAPEPTAEERLQAERDEFEAKWLRVVAELDNVRKRNRRELGDTRRFAQADVLRKFLDVLDDFDRALQSVRGDEDTAEGDGFRAGVELIFQNFRGVLRDLGVEPIPALDTEFDPNVHEAVGTLPREGVASGMVIEVVAGGFTLGDLVLRPARVIISS
jgi:molecular chaperone GrpE